MPDTSDVTTSDPSQAFSDFEVLTAALEGMADPGNHPHNTAAVRSILDTEAAKGAGASVASVIHELETLAALALLCKGVLERRGR
jgi:hypothetical protein